MSRRGDAYLIEMDAIVYPQDETLWPKTYEDKAKLFFSEVFEIPVEASE